MVTVGFFAETPIPNSSRPSGSQAIGPSGFVELAVFVTVERVENDADDEPDAEAFPRLARQADHDEDAGRYPERSHTPHQRNPERTLAVRFLDAKHEHARTHEREREQRPDVRQIVSFRGIADHRRDRNE